MNLIKALIIIAISSTTLLAGFAKTDKLVAEAIKEVGEVTPKTLKKMIDNEEAFIVLDIREIKDRQGGEIYSEEYYALTRGSLEFEVGNIIKDKNVKIVTYCLAGNAGALAAQTLRNLGYEKATNLQGGLKAWAEAGYPIETSLGVLILNKEDE